MTTIKTIFISFGAYLLAGAGTMIYLFIAAVASFGDRCYTSSESCSITTTTLQYLIPLVFGVLALTLQSWFFKNKLRRKIPQIYMELTYIIPIFIGSYLVGNKIVSSAVASRANPNSVPGDTLTVYLSVIGGITICVLISSWLQLRVSRNIHSK